MIIFKLIKSNNKKSIFWRKLDNSEQNMLLNNIIQNNLLISIFNY